METVIGLGSSASTKKPWGAVESIFTNLGEGEVSAKIIRISPGSRLSLQTHRRRSETWFVVDGTVHVQVGKKHLYVPAGGVVSIPVGVQHRMGSSRGATVLEVARGFFDEGDITRIEDDYGRV